MAKFKTGDRFVVSESGVAGTVKGTSFNSIAQEDEYVVTWDTGYGGTCSYAIIDVDPIWDLASSGINPFSPAIISPATFPNAYSQMPKRCNHSWKASVAEPGKTQWCASCDERK